MNKAGICNKKAWWIFGENEEDQYDTWVKDEINNTLKSIDNVFAASTIEVDAEMNEKVLGNVMHHLDTTKNNITAKLKHGNKKLVIQSFSINTEGKTVVNEEIDAKCKNGYITKINKSTKDTSHIVVEVKKSASYIRVKAEEAVKKEERKEGKKREKIDEKNELIKAEEERINREQGQQKDHEDDHGDAAFRQFG